MKNKFKIINYLKLKITTKMSQMTTKIFYLILQDWMIEANQIIQEIALMIINISFKILRKMSKKVV